MSVAEQESAAEMAAARLARWIEAKRLPPGAPLPPVTQLSKEFDVRPAVMRDAMVALKAAGKIADGPRADVFVAGGIGRKIAFEIEHTQEFHSAMQILELRVAVELQSAALAATRRTSEALAEITRCFDRIDLLETTDPEAEAKADFEFHLAIARATGNPHFPRFLETVMSEVSFQIALNRRKAAGDKDWMPMVNKEHALILSAITQRDARRAQAAMAQHFEESLTLYAQLLAK